MGSVKDDVFSYGCDLLFSEIALSVCKQEGIDLRFNSLDTTSFSLTGEYDRDSDEHGVLVTYGYSKDHRPDLRQVILELRQFFVIHLYQSLYASSFSFFCNVKTSNLKDITKSSIFYVSVLNYRVLKTGFQPSLE